MGAHVDQPSWTSGEYVSAFRGCWPLKFLHALEIHQGLLAHNLNGYGVPPPKKKLKDEHVKFGLKMSVCARINLRIVGVSL